MLTTADITITHPASYGLRSYVIQIENRADTASDAAQIAKLKALFVEVNTARVAGDTLQEADMLADVDGHLGIHMKWLCSDMVYRSIDEADINTDLATIETVVAAL